MRPFLVLALPWVRILSTVFSKCWPWRERGVETHWRDAISLSFFAQLTGVGGLDMGCILGRDIW